MPKINALANYKQHRQSFDALCQIECEQRILLFQGQSGFGKTSLLHYCAAQARKQDLPVLTFDFKHGFNTDTFFQQSASFPLSDSFPRVAEQISADISQINMDGVKQEGQGHTLAAIIQHPGSPAPQRLHTLTQAWLTDAQALTSPLLLFIDHFPQAHPELTAEIQAVRQWLLNRFLPGI